VTATPSPVPGTGAGAGADGWPADAVEVGRIVGAWGVKGGIKVHPLSANPQALLGSRRWHLAPPEGGLPRPAAAAVAKAGAKPVAPAPALLKVTSVRTQGEHVVAMAQDLADRDAAQALKGLRVFISRASFPSTDEDEFYWVDLIGLGVFNRDSVALGSVVGLIETGPHCVLRILPPGPAEAAPAEELLIPFVAAYVDAVDLPGKRLTVDWALDGDAL
jgi:16S rRNA processing protein RimM